ncbi:serine/threonine protein kinase [Actinomadura sp. DC4]|uniref:serine/threonine protein kinase n=1 Tax=Actinomadura sp. DC4 TaxID=3055069 RepID=UPI0025AEFA25|nr:serine/threonine protein kinase [Actinomadura sp. DC4]MDN3358765.1 serine/threonine protein kinase [Actinomadura sp. DC4]
MIPRYTLGAELGRGGMGTVWSAVEDATGENVAIKVVPLTDPLLDEARRASAVDHPGVVRIRDHGAADDVAWIVMDLVPGRDLRRYIEETGPLAPSLAARVVADAADALAAVHAAGLVHRDVKPANILLDESEGALAVRLTDFGIAAPGPPPDDLSEASDWARTEPGPSRAGTYAYMAPEQWSDATATAQSDIWALGGVLYTALTGELPYPKDSLPELAHAVAMAPPPRVPGAYDEVIAAAMAKDPSERVRSAADLAAALRAVAEGRKPALPRRPTRRLWLASAVVLLVGVCGLLGWHPWTAHSSTRPLRRVVCAQDLELRDRPRGVQTGTLEHGDVVSVLRRDGSQRWAYIRTPDGHRGWVLGSWVRPACR